MATFYLDFEGGNDSNDGLSFTNRWKTITSGATAARTAPGDVIRIMKSPAPVSLGVNGTFTKSSGTVTLASAVTANIDLCDVAWTTADAVNVAVATSSTRKQGTLAITVAPTAAFTTGLMAYRATGALNLSTYQKVSFWIRSSVALSANALRLDLCSDTAGATPVHSITLNTAFAANAWKPVTWDNAAALSASIQSVALVALTDFGAATITVDNIIACNSLHFNALIGTSASETSTIWYPIRSINGTTVTMEVSQNGIEGTNAMRGWADATVTTLAYARPTIQLPAIQTVAEGGSDIITGAIEYSGGWDRTNMSTQDGLSILQADTNLGTNTLVLTSRGNLILRRIGMLWGSSMFTANTASQRYYDIQMYGMTFSPGQVSDTTYWENLTVIGGAASFVPVGGSIVNGATIYSNGTNGFSVGSPTHCPLIKNVTAANNTGAGVITASSAIIQNLVSRDNSTFGLNVSGYAEVNGYQSSGNTSGGITNAGLLKINNATIAEATPITTTVIQGMTQTSRYSTFSGMIHTGSIYVQDVSTPIRGSATRSYRHAHTATPSFTTLQPLVQQLQPFAVSGGATVTFSIWVQRSATSVEGRIRLLGWVTPGVNADVTSTTTAAINTWEQLTVTCTPSAAGVVMVQLETYSTSASAGNVFFCDSTVLQQ